MTTVTEAEVIQMVREHMEGLFPKVCPSCKRRFSPLREFMLITQRLEPVISYDADSDDWSPSQPIGPVALANCPCGSKLALTSKGLPLSKLWQFLDWVRIEMERLRLSQEELPRYVRDEHRKQVLAEPGQGDT
jgi:hypothetical protein